MKKRFFLYPLFGFLLFGCVSSRTANGPTLEERIALQDQQLRQIQPQQADTWNEVQAMRQEINDLKGQLDDLKNVGGARALADRVRQHDAALRQVDDNMSLNLNLGDPISQRTVQQETQNPATPNSGIALAALPSDGQPARHSPDSSAYGAYGASSQAVPSPQVNNQQMSSYGLPPDPVSQPVQPNVRQPGNMSELVAAPAESTWGQPDPQPKPETEAPKKDISLALFDAGVNAYNARKYSEAARSFTDFLKNYKGHTQAAEAQFYLADCDFQRNNFPQAALAYDEVIKKYPKSSSAPKAYLKQAISFGKMNQKEAARARMQELIKKYPSAPEVARAKSYLKNNK